MKIEIQIDESCDEPKIVVMTRRVTEEISEILKKLSEDPSEMPSGFRDERASIAGNERASQKAVGGHPFTDEPPTAFYWNRYQAKVIRRCRARP